MNSSAVRDLWSQVKRMFKVPRYCFVFYLFVCLSWIIIHIVETNISASSISKGLSLKTPCIEWIAICNSRVREFSFIFKRNKSLLRTVRREMNFVVHSLPATDYVWLVGWLFQLIINNKITVSRNQYNNNNSDRQKQTEPNRSSTS